MIEIFLYGYAIFILIVGISVSILERAEKADGLLHEIEVTKQDFTMIRDDFGDLIPLISIPLAIFITITSKLIYLVIWITQGRFLFRKG
jgi:hypothetical protein